MREHEHSTMNAPRDDEHDTVNGSNARGAATGDIHQIIEAKVRAAFDPKRLEVIDESYMHSVPEGAASHFRVFVVSDAFEGKSAVQRHQAVYAVLAEEVEHHIHALGLQTMTPVEWAADQQRNESPECLGGSKAEA